LEHFVWIATCLDEDMIERGSERSAQLNRRFLSHMMWGASLKKNLTTFRDIFGNPFRPVVFEPAWRTSTAVALAQQMYDSRDFGIMPILGDALQDAGCDNDNVLDHCRGPGPHVRGCWVVDLVLGKQ
jgi:hypothetical protein